MVIYKIKSLLAEVKDKNPKADLSKIEEVYNFANEAHKGQKRISGEDFVQHPLAVAYFLAELGMDEATICASLLHDVCEDTGITLEKVKEKFGAKIAELVTGVTKLKGLRYYSAEGQVENLRKMFLAMAADIRVVLIRLADRLHNLKTLDTLSPEKRKRVARQTIEIYAPLADRLGMGNLKGQFEDLAFPYFLPWEYKWVKKLVGEATPKREKYVRKVINYLRPKLKSAGVKIIKIDGRAKNLYSIYQKLLRYDKDISKIYDLLAIRIIVPNTEACYKALGVIHSEFKPLLGRIKDYIAIPKPNGYQALHTTVFGLEGKLIEIQIKTPKMHEEAEWGVAAHFVYSEKKDGFVLPKEKISWLKQIGQWQKDLSSLDEFSEVLAADVLGSRIYVFTPAGDIKELPEGATPIDFAYEVHSELGNRCIGAKVNGKLVSLDKSLENGDVVEILTSKLPHGPSHDWLSFVKTREAKSKIRAWFKKINLGENLRSGRAILEKELLKLTKKSLSGISKEKMKKVCQELGCKNFEELLVAIGEGSLLPSIVVRKLIDIKEFLPREKRQVLPRLKPGILVAGEKGVKLNIASCCKPSLGDTIVGYIARGKVAVHKKNCPTLGKKDRRKLVSADWVVGENLYQIPVKITALDRVGLLADIGFCASSLSINLIDVTSKVFPDKSTVIAFIIEVKDFGQIDSFFRKIENIPGIIKIERESS